MKQVGKFSGFSVKPGDITKCSTHRGVKCCAQIDAVKQPKLAHCISWSNFELSLCHRCTISLQSTSGVQQLTNIIAGYLGLSVLQYRLVGLNSPTFRIFKTVLIVINLNYRCIYCQQTANNGENNVEIKVHCCVELTEKN